jgi:four helix bundle protein
MADYRKLRVYPKAHRLVVATHRSARRMSGPGSAALQDQIIRAAVSVPANIIEGCDQESAAEFVRFLRYSRASVSELQGHIKVAKDIGMIPEAEALAIRKRIITVRKMLSGLIKKVRMRIPPNKRKRKKP